MEHGDLGFGIGSQIINFPALANLLEPRQKGMAVVNRGGHQGRGGPGGILKIIAAELEFFSVISDVPDHSPCHGLGIHFIPAPAGNLSDIGHEIRGHRRLAGDP